MGFYENRILPYLVHLSMRQETFSAYRRRVVPPANGRVLEIGIGSGLNLPFYADAAIQIIGLDTVVTTWTLCTIPDVNAALRETRRVLKPSGALQFVEHGCSPAARVRCWQDRLRPVWKRVGGGCHLNRPIRELLQQSGFRIEQIERDR